MPPAKKAKTEGKGRKGAIVGAAIAAGAVAVGATIAGIVCRKGDSGPNVVSAAASPLKKVPSRFNAEVDTKEVSSWLPGGNESLFETHELALLNGLRAEGQEHLWANWPPKGKEDAKKKAFVKQLCALDDTYNGGLGQYIRNARGLLKDAKEGTNPLDGYTPSVPEGRKLDVFSGEFLEMEASGLRAAHSAAFVLVAGGLGERLGYSGIKVSLPVDQASGMCYLELYIRSILALQTKSGRELPLAIMTSDDTHDRTIMLLKSKSYFGMKASQVTLIKQEKVACLMDSDARLSIDPKDAYAVETKPHGHGDVHALLHSSGLVDKWAAEGFEWVCFFQDTNAFAFRGLIAALGVSANEGYDMNSIAVPRRAKEAVGAIALLEPTQGSGNRRMTINVEYNQLDPLLRATTNPQGDVNDASGFSPFPGNINQLILKVATYKQVLHETGGIIAEFVNPKYKDDTRTAFKKSTRLECMMQDYPKCLPRGAQVGFTSMDPWFAYSAVKNSPADALGKYKNGDPTHSATSGELDWYAHNARLLEQLTGAKIGPAQKLTFNGMAMDVPPLVSLGPRFATTLAGLSKRVRDLDLAQGSSLVVDGDVWIDGLTVEGAVVFDCAPGVRLEVTGLTVKNGGWGLTNVDSNDNSEPEELRIRGFKLDKFEELRITITKAGVYEMTGEDKAPRLKPNFTSSTTMLPARDSSKNLGRSLTGAGR
ncbi:unnamed protein product [Pedinophyceae sp. YPF-701]|nr:unnamed protein product [Pedinophyceae sp. YPF-701]